MSSIQHYGICHWSEIRRKLLPEWDEVEIRIKACRLLGIQNIEKYEDWKEFWEIINFEQSVKFVALNTVLGIIHNDYWHNHEFFYDRTLGKIEPIVSDAQSLGTYVYPWGKDRLSMTTLLSKEKPDHTISINQKTNPYFRHYTTTFLYLSDIRNLLNHRESLMLNQEN